jgi:small-conductance mechanosensitive channel
MALQELVNASPFLPNLVFIIIVITGTVLVEFLIDRLYKDYVKKHGPRYTLFLSEMTIRLIVFFVGIFLVLSVIPGITTNMMRLLVAAVGIILALSSTTIIANGMAGLMIKLVNSYRIGDMVEIGGHLGKVSEIGMFHTEIQTPKRGLVTVPNYVVMRDPFINYTEAKYIVHVPVTLSYDTSREKVEDLLMKALKKTELEDPFVLVTELGNYWVKYEANGLLGEVSKLISVESDLKRNILDEFNKAKVEILSPDYYAIKMVPEKFVAIPPEYRKGKLPKWEVKKLEKLEKEEKKAEEIMFEKATKEEVKAKDEFLKKNFLSLEEEALVTVRKELVNVAKAHDIEISKSMSDVEIAALVARSDLISLEDLKTFFSKIEIKK